MTGRREYIYPYFSKIMKENEDFLKRYVKYVLDETVELINDAIDCLASLVKKDNAKELMIRQPWLFMFFLYLCQQVIPSLLIYYLAI